MRYKIQNIYIFTTIVLLILNTIIIAYFWIGTLYSEYQRDYDILKSEYLSSQKTIIKREVDALVKYINTQKDNINDRMKDEISKQITHISDFFQNISISYKDFDKKDYNNILITTMQAIANHNKNLFVLDKNKNLIASNYTFEVPKELIEKTNQFLQNNSSGFIVVNKITDNKADILISYVKKVSNDFYLGYYSSYLDMEKTVKKELIEKINSMKFSEDNYFFAFDINGNVILNQAQPHFVGTNIYNLTIENNRKLVQEEIQIANENKFGDFIEYEWFKPSIKENTKKIAFIKKVQDWNWIVGTGIYLDSINQKLKDKEVHLHNDINRDIERIILVLIVSTFIAIAILSYLSNRLKNSFDTLDEFFKRAFNDFVKIDNDKLFFEEFKTLSQTINDMLENRIKAEIKLKEYNKELETRVEKEINNRREKELLLIQQSKMASMGEMIGNIAHQWRQPLSELSTIFMNINFKYKKNSLSQEFLEQKIAQSEQIIDYMSNTIDDFRNFYNVNKNKEDFNIYKSCQNTFNILKSSLKYHYINFIFNVNKDLSINGYKSEFEQALLNIISNAKDVLVINNIDNATIKVYTRVEEDNIAIVIEDNGGGIKIKPIEKIYEPYFTTKHQYKGTGIGLYMAKMIIENNHFGELRAYNIKDGARFEIIFSKSLIIDRQKTDV